MRQPFVLPPCSTIRSGPQRLGCCNGGFISPASRSDAGSVLGHGKCSAHDRQRSPSSAPVNARGSASLRVCAGLHSCAKLALSFAPQRSPRADLFSGCAGAGVGRTSSHCHHHTPPLHLPASAMRPLASPPPPLSPSLPSPPPLWPPTPRRHAATDTTQDAPLRSAGVTYLRECPRGCPCEYPRECPRACALALVRTARTHHRNLRAVPCTHTRHRRRRRGQCASPGTRKHCPAQQWKGPRRNATN